MDLDRRHRRSRRRSHALLHTRPAIQRRERRWPTFQDAIWIHREQQPFERHCRELECCLARRGPRSNPLQIVLDSGECFQKFHETCAHCATVGNEHCFYARGNEHIGCLLCVADGVSCSHNSKSPDATSASLKRREAVLKLVGVVGDREWAAKVLEEYEAAEEECNGGL